MISVADKKYPLSYLQRAFSLLELLIGILVFGLGMLFVSSTLFPMLSKSADPVYEARAVAVGQSVLSQILALQFDQNSDPNGSQWRCDENADAILKRGGLSPQVVPACSRLLGQGKSLISVGDYMGCWGIESSCAGLNYKGTMAQLLGGDLIDAYKGFTVKIHVDYDAAVFPGSPNTRLHKRVDLEVDAGKYGKYDFSAYRSNF